MEAIHLAGRRAALAVLLALCVVSGCAAKPSAQEPTPQTPLRTADLAFVGTWTATGADGVALIDGYPIRLELSDTAIAATAGCQLLTTSVTAGQVETIDGSVTAELVGGLEVTTDRQIACSEELNALDEWLTALLTGPMRWEQSRSAVTVTAGDNPSGSLKVQRVLSPSAADPSTFDDPGLNGSFVLSEWSPYEGSLPLSQSTDASTENAEPVAPTLLVTFDNGRLTAQGTCGTSTAMYRLTPGAMEVQNFSTVHADVACDPIAKEFDDQVSSLLTERPIVYRQDDQVSLDARSAAGFGLAINRVAVPADPDFESTMWTLRQYQRPGTDAVQVPSDVTATLEYVQGHLWMYAGCNHIGGMAYIADGFIRVSGFSSTAMGCDPPLNELDSALMAPFGPDPAAYSVDGSTLTVTSPSITLTFTR